MTHSLTRKVYYHHTDAGGVVYYGTYLKFLEEGRTELCLSCGVDTAALLRRGLSFVVVHVDIDYLASARYGDSLEVLSAVEKIGRSSIHFSQQICRAGQVLAKARVVWACVNSAFSSVPVEDGIRAALSAAGTLNAENQA